MQKLLGINTNYKTIKSEKVGVLNWHHLYEPV